MKPIVGITVSIDHGRRFRHGIEYLYVKRAYAQAIANAGAAPILISPDISAIAAGNLCHGIIISGGDDLPPQLYGETPGETIQLESEERIAWEQRLLEVFSRNRRPVLGICYGMQLINVYYGGTLYQDILDRSPIGDSDQSSKSNMRRILIPEDSFLFPLLGETASVLSTHHQGIKQLAPDFKASAKSTDGLVEALERDNIIGIQWHPESDPTGSVIYSDFVKRLREH